MIEMKCWNQIDGKMVITAEYAQHLFEIGKNCETKDDVEREMFKRPISHSIAGALLGGFDYAQGRWTVGFDTEEKTWQRYGEVRYDDMSDEYRPSYNYRDEHFENGVSVMDDEWKKTVSAQFFSGDVYEFKGIQVAWGTDGEPLVIPTSIPRKVNGND